MRKTIKYPCLKKSDPEIARLNELEEERQFWHPTFIASQNYTSVAVREASSSVLTNKYSEGYPGARYYKGNELIDEIETLAEDRALTLFGLKNNEWGANVQPASGSEVNAAVYLALLKPRYHPDGEDIALGMNLDSGGHLTHGFYVSFSGKIYHFEQYGLDNNGYINYDEVEDLAKKYKPKLIVCGCSAYSRIVDFKKFSEIAKEYGAFLMADIAHIAGLIAAGEHPSPFPYCDIVTTTTHKTLRGPKGALLFARKEKSLFKLTRSGVFPGLQGGPHNQQTMAIAVCLKEASTANFRAYAKKVIANAAALADALKGYGFNIVSGGTDNHLMLVDLRPFKISGKDASDWLYKANIETNMNAVPNDPLPKRQTSGIRLGTPALTTRGMGVREMKLFAKWIHGVITNPSEENIDEVKRQVKALCKKFPPPGF